MRRTRFMQRSATAVVVGVANQRSLAWSCALSLLHHRNFDQVVVTYQNERFQKSVEAMVKKQNDLYVYQHKQNVSQSAGISMSMSSPLPTLSCVPCDVTNEEEVRILFDQKIPSVLATRDSTLDALIHSVAYAPAEAMKSATGSLPLTRSTSKESFEIAHSVSSFSLITLGKHALPLLSCQDDPARAAAVTETETETETETGRWMRSPSITALTYLGSTRAVQNYNVMGPAKASLEAVVRGLALELSPQPHCIRVNAVSAGPVNTLAARGIRDFTKMKHDAEERSLLRRSVTSEEVGNMVEFIASKRASGVTGQVLFCDGGYCAMGG